MKAVVSEKGQITIPKKLRDRLGIKTGQALEFSEKGGKLIAVKTTGADSIEKAYGILKTRLRTDKLVQQLRGPVDAVARNK